MITDEVKIKVEAGKGGDGIASFHREKYVAKGGPDGGDGGRGGSIIFVVDESVNTLNYFNTNKEFKADNGQNGGKAKCSGKGAQDLVLRVPNGTIVYELDGDEKNKLFDLKEKNQEAVIVKGGRGGLGNIHFASATNQTPLEFTLGKPGEKNVLMLELQMIADVGLVGLPNAGKSTLLARISRAKPKIADYPFTTLEPNLGVAQIDDFGFVVADIPGLIEGAHVGKGLGHKFLRHIKRTRLIVHLIDPMSGDVKKDYKTIRNELKKFDRQLIKRPEIVVVTKIEVLNAEDIKKIKKDLIKQKPLFISSVTGSGIKELLYEIKRKLI